MISGRIIHVKRNSGKNPAPEMQVASSLHASQWHTPPGDGISN